MNLNLNYVLGAIPVILIGAYVFWPAFRQMVQIKLGIAVAGATKASEKMANERDTLMAAVRQQLTSVATIKGSAQLADTAVKDAQKALDDRTSEYKLVSQSGGASESALNTLYGKVEKAQADLIAKQKMAEVTHAQSVKAVRALDSAREALKGFSDKIEATQRTEEMTKVLNTAADSSLALKDINDKISGAGSAAAQAERDLATAEARANLAEGSDADREAADAVAKVNRSAGRAALDAKLGITPPAASAPEQK